MSDHFSTVAKHYAEARPTYPAALFEWLAAQVPLHDLVWDVGAGSGQASVALAEHFAHVHATDLSAEQVKSASPHPRIGYRTAASDDSGLEAGCADLITVAQALHWFDLPRFYTEVRRVLKPEGVIAVWSYGVLYSDNEALNTAVWHLHNEIVGPYWPPERHDVENGYINLDFPFTPIDPPNLSMTADWDLNRLLGYFRSWSATARMEKATGVNPIDAYAPTLAELWGPAEKTRTLNWPLMVKAGRL